jgi:hypothetical protein
MVLPLQTKTPAQSQARPHHARAIAPDHGIAVDSKGQRYNFGAHNPASVGPDTIIILHGRPPQRAHEHYKQSGGNLPPEVMRHVAPQHRHPGEIVRQLANAAHKELPTHNQKGALPMGGVM